MPYASSGATVVLDRQERGSGSGCGYGSWSNSSVNCGPLEVNYWGP